MTITPTDKIQKTAKNNSPYWLITDEKGTKHTCFEQLIADTIEIGVPVDVAIQLEGKYSNIVGLGGAVSQPTPQPTPTPQPDPQPTTVEQVSNGTKTKEEWREKDLMDQRGYAFKDASELYNGTGNALAAILYAGIVYEATTKEKLTMKINGKILQMLASSEPPLTKKELDDLSDDKEYTWDELMAMVGGKDE